MVCHIGVVRANVNRVSFVFAHIFFCVNSMDTSRTGVSKPTAGRRFSFLNLLTHTIHYSDIANQALSIVIPA